MDIEVLKKIVAQAQEAVKDVKEESLRKIAFQKILDTLLTPEIPCIPLEPSSDLTTGKTRKAMEPVSKQSDETISDFFNRKGPKTNTNMVLSFAYYLHYNGCSEFNLEDIIKAYRQLLIPPSSNPTDIINANIRSGYIQKLDKKKNSKQAYQITKNGIKFVDNNFKSDK